MGCCSSLSSLRTHTTAGSRKALHEVSWDGGFDIITEGIEVGGIPLAHFLGHFSGLRPCEQEEVVSKVLDESSLPSTSRGRGVCRKQQVRVAVLSWNVGGISDHRKDSGAGIEQSAKGAVVDVLAAAMNKIEGVDVIVVGLQEMISLTPNNAMRALSSVGDTKRRGFYGWPETVAQWVELLVGGFNAHVRTRVPSDDSRTRSNGTPDSNGNGHDNRTYVLYGQPVYLFGMLLCVFCRTEILRHIKDFAMVEVAMDNRFHSGCKGVVACRFVLFDRSFCFINCHLSAQKKNNSKYNLRSFEKRMAEMQRCWTEIKFKSHIDQMVYPVSAHRAVFLLGDTNMRLTNSTPFKSNAEFHKDILQSLESDPPDYRGIWPHDQLFAQLNAQRVTQVASSVGRSSSRTTRSSTSRSSTIRTSRSNKIPRESGNFSLNSLAAEIIAPAAGGTPSGPCGGGISMWKEPVLSEADGPPFPPTFKLEVPGPGYSRKRVPAWTDRVLFRCQHAHPLKYDSVVQAKVLEPPKNISDHDPIYACFEVDCIRVNSRKLQALVREVRHRERRDPLLQPASRMEQALDFRTQVLAAAEPEIEEFSQRLFTSLQEFDSIDDMVAGATQILECQEECWRIVCHQLEEQIRDSITQSRTASQAAASPDCGRSQLDIDVFSAALKRHLAGLRGGLPDNGSTAGVPRIETE